MPQPLAFRWEWAGGHPTRPAPSPPARSLKGQEEPFQMQTLSDREAPEAIIRLSYHVPTSHLSSARVQTRYLGRPLLTAGRASASE